MMSRIDVFPERLQLRGSFSFNKLDIFFCGVFHKKDRATHTKVLGVLSTFLEMNIFSGCPFWSHQLPDDRSNTLNSEL